MLWQTAVTSQAESFSRNENCADGKNRNVIKIPMMNSIQIREYISQLHHAHKYLCEYIFQNGISC